MLGCDLTLNSGKALDRCRECGGDGDTCESLMGVIHTKHLEIGTCTQWEMIRVH